MMVSGNALNLADKLTKTAIIAIAIRIKSFPQEIEFLQNFFQLMLPHADCNFRTKFYIL